MSFLDDTDSGKAWGDELEHDDGDPSTSATTSPLRKQNAVRPAGSRAAPVIKSVMLSTVQSGNPLGPLGPLDPLADQNSTTEPATTAAKPEDGRRLSRDVNSGAGAGNAGLVEGVDQLHIRTENGSAAAGPSSGSVPADDRADTAGTDQVAAGLADPAAQAANFHITVVDPHRVGLMTTHVQYNVHTLTNSKAFREPDFTVSRRYRHFLWLYGQLHANHPGVFVPPPPGEHLIQAMSANTKDSLHESEFIEGRKQGLERMLNRIAAHPQLRNDNDFRVFLESENFDLKARERKPAGTEQKGMMHSFGFGRKPKYIETDAVLVEKKSYIDKLESQLKRMQTAVRTVSEQRQAMSAGCKAFKGALGELARFELSKSLSNPLADLAELQNQLSDVYGMQAKQDQLTVGIVLDEYIRLIDSIRQAYDQRRDAFSAWTTAKSELESRQNSRDVMAKTSKTQQDALETLKNQIVESNRKVNQARLHFEGIGRQIRAELDRFEREKVEDFSHALETYLETAVATQTALIEKWELFARQLDAEEHGVTLAQAISVGVQAERPAERVGVSSQSDDA